ncbi:MAG TPA: glycoside hydrolase family 57 protein [Ohtaekwangia sp.]|nr:glycoside hydrolase family 57 protein [Ohtaekwangia sp.]
MTPEPQLNRNLILYFQVHQPRRLENISFFDVGSSGHYFNDELNKQIVTRIARECYLPANALLLRLIKKYPTLKIGFSISGIALDQFEEFAPEVLDSFRQLARTGSVEFLSETYYHSLASMMQGDEFEAQVIKHAERIYELFSVRPTVFCNAELIYNDEIGRRIAMMGFDGIMTEGHEHIVTTPNRLYEHPDNNNLKILLRNYKLSDDISLRYGDYALTAEEYMAWLNGVSEDSETILLGMNYETFGEHHKKESGIFTFLESFLTALGKQHSLQMVLPSDAVKNIPSRGTLSVQDTISWCGEDHNLLPLLGNEMQRDSFYTVSRMEQSIKGMNDPHSLRYWRCLLTTDHFYYMSTWRNSDDPAAAYFSHYPSAYEAFINYMNVIADFSINAQQRKASSLENASMVSEQERQQTRVPTWAITAGQHHT